MNKLIFCFPTYYDDDYDTVFFIPTLAPKYNFSIPVYYDEIYNMYFIEHVMCADKLFVSEYFHILPI